MKVRELSLPGLKRIEPQVHGDRRGYFLETWQAERFAAAGLSANFVQDNLSRSERGSLRGLHYQLPHAQGKLVWVGLGQVFDVVVDIRRGSPQFGRWHGEVLSDQDHHQLFIPPGFAHGFLVLSETADFHYKCTDTYHSEAEHGVLWSDPQIAISWPLADLGAPIISTKDAAQPTLAQVPDDRLPAFESDR
jgi:dTDP-4-dehydrorhamnose 3,5-epimerase